MLLLNRLKSPNMGLWNGVGGKLDPHESPQDCIVRETFEETGLQLPQYKSRGVVLWNVDDENLNGMYIFTAEVTKETVDSYRTPVQVSHEGILDWKPWLWVVHNDNLGVVSNIKLILKTLLNASAQDKYMMVYKGHTLVDFQYIKNGNVDHPVEV